MSKYYDKQGNPIEMMEWGELFENFAYKVIKQDTLPDGKWVSTVWLGLDHGYGEGKPLIFETMVFNSGKEMDELDMDRYSTLEEAQRGHENMVRKYSK